METQSVISNAQILEKLTALEQLVMQMKGEDKKGLWGIQDVADYCGMSYRHVYGNIVADPRFPAQVDVQSRTGGNSKPLFVKEEVIEFFKRYKKKKHRI